MRIIKITSAYFLLGVLSLAASAQTTIFSPYSRYGLGDLSLNSHAVFIGMGGLSLTQGGSSHINHDNPASYVWIDSTTFLFEAGISSIGVQVKTQSLSGSANYTSLNSLQMAFPITRRWGASLGLLPYSQMGYRLSYSQTFDSVGNVRYNHRGYGGLNQFYFGNAFRPIPNLSIGLNAAWLFGNLNKVQIVDFDTNSYFDIKHQVSTVVGDFYFDLGLRYSLLLSARDKEDRNDDVRLDLGLVYGLATSINAREDILSMTVISNQSTGFEYVKDTVQLINGERNDLAMPWKLGGGLSVSIGSRWMIGAQYLTQNWSDFSYSGIPDTLQNSYQYHFGVQFMPDALGKSYFQRVKYRAGFRYHQTYLNLNNTPLTEYGMSFGLGLPLKNDKTSLNFGIELGKRGTTENNLVLENFGKFSFGISVNERWFVKRKFD